MVKFETKISNSNSCDCYKSSDFAVTYTTNKEYIVDDPNFHLRLDDLNSGLNSLVGINIFCNTIYENPKQLSEPVSLFMNINDLISLSTSSFSIMGIESSNIYSIVINGINVPKDRKVKLEIKLFFE